MEKKYQIFIIEEKYQIFIINRRENSLAVTGYWLGPYWSQWRNPFPTEFIQVFSQIGLC